VWEIYRNAETIAKLRVGKEKINGNHSSSSGSVRENHSPFDNEWPSVSTKRPDGETTQSNQPIPNYIDEHNKAAKAHIESRGLVN
jgi:hypothetical protein